MPLDLGKVFFSVGVDLGDMAAKLAAAKTAIKDFGMKLSAETTKASTPIGNMTKKFNALVVALDKTAKSTIEVETNVGRMILTFEAIAKATTDMLAPLKQAPGALKGTATQLSNVGKAAEKTDGGVHAVALSFLELETQAQKSLLPLKNVSDTMVQTSKTAKDLNTSMAKMGHGSLNVKAPGIVGALGDWQTQMGLLFGGMAISSAFTAPFMALAKGAAESSIGFESAFAGVRKTVNATEGEFKDLETRFRDMSQVVPVAAEELAKIGMSAGQLGVRGVDNIQKFTDVVAKLGVATNLSTEAAATELARFANIMQMPISNADKLGSTIVELGNNTATTEAEIVAFAMRIAGAGKQVGLSEAEVLGFSAALSSVGIDAEAGGTAISRVFARLAVAVSDGGDELKNFAAVAGMSTKQFADTFATDAAGATVAFVTGLKRMQDEGTNLFGVMEQLGMDDIRVRDALLRTAGAGDILSKSLGIATQAWSENNALNKEAAARFATTESAIKILQNTWDEFTRQIGDAFKPMIIGAVDNLKSLVIVLQELPMPVKEVGMLFGGLLATIGPLLIGMAALGAIILGVKSASTALLGIFGPVGLAIIGVAVVLGTAYLAWKTYQTGQEQAALAGAAHSKQLSYQVDSLRKLRDELEQLNAKSKLTTEEQARMRDVAGQIADVAPEAAGGIDEMTGAITSMDTILTGANDKLAFFLSQSKVLAEGTVTAATLKLPGLKEELAALEKQEADLTAANKNGVNALRNELLKQQTFAQSLFAMDFLDYRKPDKDIPVLAGARLDAVGALIKAKQDEIAATENALKEGAAALKRANDQVTLSGFRSVYTEPELQADTSLSRRRQAAAEANAAASETILGAEKAKEAAKKAAEEQAKAVEVMVERQRVAMAEVEGALKKTEAAWATFSAVIGDATKGAGYDAERQQYLTTKLEAQQNVVKLLGSQYEESRQLTGDLSETTLGLAGSLNTAMTAVAETSAQLREFSPEMATAKENLSSASEGVKTMQDWVKVLSGRLDDATKALSKTKDAIKELEDSTKTARGGISDILDAWKTGLQAVTDEMEALKKSTVDNQGEITSAFDVMSREVDAVKAHIKDLKSEMQSLANVKLVGETALNDQMKSLDIQQQQAELALKTLRQSGVGEKDTRINTLEKQIAKIGLQKEELALQRETTIQPLKDQLNTLVDNFVSLNDAQGKIIDTSKELTFEEVKAAIEEYQKRIVDSASEQKRMEDRTEELRLSVGDLVPSMAKARTTFDQAANSINGFKQKIVDNNEALDILTTKHTRLQTEYDTLAGVLAKINPAITLANTSFEEAKTKIDAYSKTILDNEAALKPLRVLEEEQTNLVKFGNEMMEKYNKELAALVTKETEATSALQALRDAAGAAAAGLATLGSAKPPTPATPAPSSPPAAIVPALTPTQKTDALVTAQAQARSGNLDQAASTLANAWGMSKEQAKESLAPIVGTPTTVTDKATAAEQYAAMAKTNVLNNAIQTAKSGDIEAAAKALSDAYGMSLEQARSNIMSALPQNAAGGVAFKPTVGIFGEAGTEALTPLSWLAEQMQSFANTIMSTMGKQMLAPLARLDDAFGGFNARVGQAVAGSFGGGGGNVAMAGAGGGVPNVTVYIGERQVYDIVVAANEDATRRGRR